MEFGDYFAEVGLTLLPEEGLSAPWKPKDLMFGDAPCYAHSEEIIINNIHILAVYKTLF